MNPKKPDTSKKSEPADNLPEVEFVPLQDIAVDEALDQEARQDNKKEPGEDTGEKPLLIYEKNAREERPILDVRKPAFRPDIKQKAKEGSHKARVELPEE